METKNADITISRVTGSEQSIHIQLRDRISSLFVAEIDLSLEDFALAVTGMGHVECRSQWGKLDRIGKRMEIDTLEFELPECDFTERKITAQREAVRKCPKHWTPDNYFDSQTSFFSKDGKGWARTTIRRWVDKATEIQP